MKSPFNEARHHLDDVLGAVAVALVLAFIASLQWVQ